MNVMTETAVEKLNGTVPRQQEPPPQKVPKEVTCQFLEPEDYPEWDDLVDRSPHGTIFHYSWWLTTTAFEFKILAVRNERGAIVGGMPIPFERKAGFTLFHSPTLTPYLGPVFDLPIADSICDRLHFMRTYGELIARNIISFDSLRYVVGACAPDLQGFLWAGYSVKLAYTFRFRATQSLAQISAGMTRTHVQKLTKAQRLNLKVTRDEGLEDLIELNVKTFEKQGLEPACSADFLRRLWAVAHSQERARLYVARTEADEPVAALLTVYDNRTTYQIVSGVNPEFRDIPGGYLVLWTALQDTNLAGRDFDFEGSGLRGVECFYRRWGATAMPIWRLEKAGTWLGALVQCVLDRREIAAFDRGAKL